MFAKIPLSKILLYIVLIGITGIYLIPLVYMLIGSFKPDDQVLSVTQLTSYISSDFTADNYFDVLQRVHFFRYLLNSVLITSSVVIGGLVVNSMAAYVLARFHWPGQQWILAIILATMMVPLEAVAIPLFYQMSLLGLRDTYFVQIIPFIGNAFFIYLFYTYFLSLPKELEEAAYMDGASALRTFWFIVVPNCKPIYSAVAILAFLMQWSNFIWPLLITSQESVRPLSLAISTFYTLPPLQWGDLFAFGVMMVTPVIVVFIVFQKRFVQSIVTGSFKN